MYIFYMIKNIQADGKMCDNFSTKNEFQMCYSYLKQFVGRYMCMCSAHTGNLMNFCNVKKVK